MLRVLSKKPFRDQTAVEVEHTYETGFWFWKKQHTRTARYVTQDGVCWRRHPGDVTGYASQVSEDASAALHEALETFLTQE